MLLAFILHPVESGVRGNGQFPNWQSCSFITVHGQFEFSGLGYDCQAKLYPSKHKISILTVCDKSYYINKKAVQKGDEIEILLTYVLV